ncbi:DNA/RNA non-specific endonuclease [Streptomyces sp. NBC_01420]|uniref:DNA/RNA non-specific endonuclease n=1 Tax=unclassified Streptomyces TaxID=2593676 RepID=UPI00387015E0
MRGLKPITGNLRHLATFGVKKYVGYLGGLGSRCSINICHLLGNDLSGSGTNPRNVATCSRQAKTNVKGNGRIDDHVYSYEARVKAAVDAGQVVYYKVTPEYSGNRTVPVSGRCDR